MNDMHKIDYPRVRMTTSDPSDVDDNLMEVLAQGGNLLDYIQLPVQSGSNEILMRMNVKDKRESYLELEKKNKEEIPNVTLTTYIIVGFPNETKDQFEETMTLMEEVGFEAAYTFIYSPREGTPAAVQKDEVSEEHTSELQSRGHLVCRLLLEKKKLILRKQYHQSYVYEYINYNIISFR